MHLRKMLTLFWFRLASLLSIAKAKDKHDSVTIDFTSEAYRVGFLQLNYCFIQTENYAETGKLDNVFNFITGFDYLIVTKIQILMIINSLLKLHRSTFCIL